MLAELRRLAGTWQELAADVCFLQGLSASIQGDDGGIPDDRAAEPRATRSEPSPKPSDRPPHRSTAESTDRKPPVWERRLWQGTLAAAGLIAAIWAALGIPSPYTLLEDLFSSELPSSNTEIVLDASAGMGDPFGGDGTKLDAAIEAVASYAVPRANEGLALRSFGGPCEEAGDLLVDFGENHNDDVGDMAAGVQHGGPSNLANAVIAAIDDFADSDRFPDPDSPKQVVVFTGTVDECLGEDAAEDIRSEVERTGINAVFKLVGVNVSQEDRAQLRALKDALGNDASVDFANTPEELADVVDALEQPPARPVAGARRNHKTGNQPRDEEPQASASGGGKRANGFALNREGFALVEEGRYAQAIPLLKRAVRRLRLATAPTGSCDEDANPDARLDCYAYALFNLGHALRLGGRPDEAILILKQRLELPNQIRLVRRELKAARAEAGGEP
jgi:tetratricopeptide (TPR) repeat protein